MKYFLVNLIACNALLVLFIERDACGPHCSFESKVRPSTFGAGMISRKAKCQMEICIMSNDEMSKNIE